LTVVSIIESSKAIIHFHLKMKNIPVGHKYRKGVFMSLRKNILKVTHILMAVMFVVLIAACAGKDDKPGGGSSKAVSEQKFDPESDFKAEPIEGGKSVCITEYIGSKWEVNIPPQIQGLPVTNLEGYWEKKTSVETYIGGAFWNKNLIKVTIPNTVIFIGECEFDRNQLTNVIIPDSVKTVGRWAFAHNPITSVTIPSNAEFDDFVFAYCPLISITIGEDANVKNAFTFNVNENDVGFVEFNKVYEANGKSAGTYTRPDPKSTTWTKQ